MNEQMHPIYTEIPQRSYDALVRSGTLEEVLLALMTDPLAAEDVAEELEAKTRKPPVLAPSVFADLGANVIDAWKITIAQWVMTQADARPALRATVTYDRRLGVWCTCQAAREALSYVLAGEERPRIAIETAEEWVKGRSSIEQVRQSVYGANAANAAAYDAAAYAASYATNAATNAAVAAHAAAYAVNDDAYAAANAADAAYFDAATYASDAAANAASAYARFAYGSAKWIQARDAELIRLREVVANACFTFPVEAMR